MFKFIKRFLAAWKLAKNPDLLDVIQRVTAHQESDKKIVRDALDNAKVAVAELVPEDRHAHRKNLDVTLQFECAEIMSPEEADRILEESRVDNKPKLPQMGRMAYCQPIAKDVDVALEAHNDKFDRHSPQ